jgi:hypothetical protein
MGMLTAQDRMSEKPDDRPVRKCSLSEGIDAMVSAGWERKTIELMQLPPFLDKPSAADASD